MKQTVVGVALLAVVAGMVAMRVRPSSEQPAGTTAVCADLSMTTWENGRVTSAELVGAGAFAPSGPVGSTPAELARPDAYRRDGFEDLPAFCRVLGTVRTSPETRITFEVWMPESTWNGKFRADGFAYFGGTMNPAVLASAVRDGYATATTDAGGDGTPRANYLVHPESLKDWSYRAWHETTVKAKTLVGAYYGRGPTLSYWNLTGGATRQGLKNIAMYPDDYDAISAGGLTNHTTRFVFAHFKQWQATHETPDSFIDPEALNILHDGAIAACDMNDGVKDSLLHDPTECRFDPGVLECRTAGQTNCLKPAQVRAARQIYSPVYHSRTGALLYEGLLPGSEHEWWRPALSPDPLPGDFAPDFFKYVVFRDPTLDWSTRQINYDSDVALVDRPEVTDVNGFETDLRPFIARGGKIFFYVGWNDNMSPLHSIEYYQRIADTIGPDAPSVVRLFMIPGMGHNPANGTRPYDRSAPPPNGYSFDPMPIITAWRERGEAPDRVIVDHRTDGRVDRQLLTCPYPQKGVYRGTGDPMVAGSYECRAPAAASASR
jgi:feruloyl esterase